MSLRVGSIDVLHRPTTAVDASDSHYDGLKESSTVLPKGHKRSEECRGFRMDTIFDRDIEIPLRDGVILRADVFRPSNTSEKIPALLAWSPYGKSGAGFFTLDLVPGRVGIPQSMLSGYEKFEAPDPAEWTARGYAVVNIDARGAFDSEGDIRWFGTAEGRDGYDAIESIAKLTWCNGKVALVGNSWLAMTQWLIAAERPPHLSCIAPFEGASDFYRELICRGGVPSLPFSGFLATKLYGRNQQEDVISMLIKYPLINEYWADKRAKIELIEVPSYVLASYSTGLHTAGSFRGFEEIPHQEKWLRVHATQEWHDLYQEERIDELQMFLDRYTKGIENGWEKTPQVRVSLLNFNKDPDVDRVFSAWPIPDTMYTSLFLGDTDTLSPNPCPTEAKISYKSDVDALQMDNDTEEVLFSYTFPQRTTMVGYSKAVLHMSCDEHDDMDVFVQLRKTDRSGKVLQNINIPLADLKKTADEVETLNTLKYLGPTGIQRASHRDLDSHLSSSHRPVHTHARTEKIPPGEIVRLVIGLWPTGMIFEEGESVMLKVAGHPLVLAEFPPLRGAFKADNHGKHTVHFGGRYDSHIVLPLVN